MFNFSKSKCDSDLQNKSKETIQYKVLSDWLRSIHAQNIQLSRKLSLIQKTIDSLLEDEPSPDEVEEFEHDKV